MGAFVPIILGEVSYLEVRNFTKDILWPLCDGGKKFLLFCTHPPTVTFGKNMSATEKQQVKDGFSEINKFIFCETTRGGKATFHDYNQIMIYPVLSLKQELIGIKSFLKNVLFAIESTCTDLGLNVISDDKYRGVWINDKGIRKKIASVGFRISDHKSDHGVALYYGTLAKEFLNFNPCGEENLVLTSLSEVIQELPSMASINELIIGNFNNLHKI